MVMSYGKNVLFLKIMIFLQKIVFALLVNTIHYASAVAPYCVKNE